jgi:radical SAM-linked protein
MAQIVCRYRKGDEVRWISHLDLKRTLERAMRRADLPLTLTEGHNPHPKLSYGPPLPLAATGDAELLAVHLSEAVDPADFKDRLNGQLPPGIEVSDAWALPAYKKKVTFGDIDVAEYRVSVIGEIDSGDIRHRVRELLARESVTVTRGGDRPERVIDLRPLILGLDVSAAGARSIDLRMRLRTGSHGGARPQEVISLLGLDQDGLQVQYRRTGLYASPDEAPPKRRTGVWRRWSRSRSRKERSR